MRPSYLFTIFIFLFLGLGAIINPTENNFYNFIFFLLFSIIVYLFLPFPSINYKIQNNNIKASLIFPFLYLFFFIIYGAPIFESNVEISRVQFSNNLGILNRILSVGMLLYAAQISENIKLQSFIHIILGISVLYLTGFRSKIADFLLVFFFAYSLNNKIYINLKSILTLSLIGFSSLYLIILQTASRMGVNTEEAIFIFFNRVFSVNWLFNIPRVNDYINANGLLNGTGYLSDFKSIFTNTLSMQEKVTSYFNSNENFIMTLTSYGESLLNFGELNLLFIPFVILFYFGLTFGVLMILLKLKELNPFRTMYLIVAIYAFCRYPVTGGYSNFLLVIMFPLLLTTPILILINNINKLRL